MSFEFIIVILAFIGNFFLSLFTLLKNPKSYTNKLFFFFGLSIAIYLILNYLSSIQSTDQSAFLWIKMVMSIAVVINLSFFLLAATFPKRNISLKSFWLISSFIFSLVVFLFAQINLIFISAKAYAASGIPGVGMPFFLLHTVIFLGGGFFLLIKKIKKSQGVEKIQVKLFLLGAIFMFSSILITNLLFVLIFNTGAFIKLLPLYTLIFIGCISYAIVKHRFLDISLIVARSVAYMLILLIIGGFYAFFIFSIGLTLLRIPFSIQQFFFYGFLTLIAAFTFQPLRRRLEIFSDRLFYKGYYDSQEVLRALSNTMSTTIILEKLTGIILEKVLSEIRITRGVFILLKKKDHGEIEYVESKGYEQNLPNFTIHDVQLFLVNKRITLFDDLEENEEKKIMRNFNVSVALPLIVHEEKIGVLFLGEKASGDIYSDKDINVLEILAPELSVAIQNAKDYEEIKRFNITLREEVDRATKELLQANERLLTLDHLKDEFVSLASHELRTPMTSIRSYVWMLLDTPNIGPLNEKQKIYLERAYHSTVRLINLVKDMLSVSRIESGKMTVTLKSTDMTRLIKELSQKYRRKHKRRTLILLLQNRKRLYPMCWLIRIKLKKY